MAIKPVGPRFRHRICTTVSDYDSRDNPQMTWRWLLILPLAWGAWDYWVARPIVHPPGVLVSAEPVQSALDVRPAPLARRGYQIMPLQSFSLAARVLSKERYRFDEGADISPVDLALGWGPMSDQSVLEAFDISQSGRFYFWHVKQFPIPRREIETHSANMHMIPANEEIQRRLLGIRAGQIVSLSGYLVEVRGPNGWHWRSSLTREDTGAGACEVVWVERLDVR
jgi:hypothetical protein